MAEKSAQANNDESTVSAATDPSVPADASALETTDGHTNGEDASHPIESIFSITIRLPHDPHETKIQVSTQEQVQDIRQSVADQPFAMQHTCFHLEHKGNRVNDFVELSEVPEIGPDSVFTLVEDPYNEKEARMHLMRIRELIGASGDRTDTIHGIAAGLSLHDSVTESFSAANETNGAATNGKPAHAHGDVSDYKFDAPGSINSLLPPPERPSPKTIKSISLSPWNPPPYHLRTKGHLLYLHLITNEGEQYHITSHVSGFFVNKSSHNKFDPYPKPAPKGSSAHSLLVLIQKLSPSFDASFQSLLDFNSKREPLALFQLSNAIPASPWLVPGQTDHQSDITRSQENYLMGGIEGTDTLRDWNEEFQSTRELPKETVQDKVFRERLISKLFADYNEAATRGAVLVARGEVPPLNPTEGRDAQIFVYNNVFFSFGADGVGTFATEGGDEAARVATGKDAMGVRAVNQLDIDGLFTPGTVVVDYLGKRIVGQSIVPGIFKQREPGEHQIDYGGVEGKDVVADNEAFTPLFEKLSSALHVKKHPVWDKEGAQHILEGSVETKGLIGTDARKYVLDLYRITPLDVPWIEQHWTGTPDEQGDGAGRKDYPHRMAVLRPELVVSYARDRLREWVNAELAKQAGSSDKAAVEEKAETNGKNKESGAEIKTDSEAESSEEKQTASEGSTELTKKDGEEAREEAEKDNTPRVDMSKFKFCLNPDVFAGQKPATEEEAEQLQNDEVEVRAVCDHLTTKVIPNLIHELQESDVGFPMNGESLSTLLHKRGINIRYLGMIASLSASDNPRLQALQRLAIQEMVSRGFKHVANQKLKHLPTPFAPACMSHLLNCLLGSNLNSNPVAETDESLRAIYSDADYSYDKVTPASLRAEIVEQIRMRYRYAVTGDIVIAGKEFQMLREVSLKLGLQLVAKQYAFTAQEKQSNGTANGHTESGGDGASNVFSSGEGKKKKKSNKSSPQRVASPAPVTQLVSFHADDILNFVPVLKEVSPKSVLAEEAYDGGRMSLAQGQKELGQELLLESLSLYEQIYGILHPEVARVYLQLSTLYYGMDNKEAAVELARKAVIVAERTMGIDASETILAYLNLGLVEHANGNSGLALSYVLHALEMWKVVYGPNHPDSITTINNAAVMLQSMKRYHESRIWFEASLAIAEEVSGKNSVNTATLLFQLAQALALDKDSHAAVNRMRESCTIFRNVLGPEDRNTKEAETWLDQLTQSAVSFAKRDKDLKSGKLKRVQFTNRVPIGARPQMQVGQTSAEAASGKLTNSRELDNRSIDELIRYIDGGDASKKTTPKKKSSNPKRRATSTAA